MDKITSLLLHISPAISLWGLSRHGDSADADVSEVAGRFVRIHPGMTLWQDPVGTMYVPLAIYLAWQVAYALKVRYGLGPPAGRRWV